MLIVGGYFLVTSLGSDKPDTPPAGASGDYGLVVGEADAPKSIVIYEDFLCPFCGQLEQTTGDQLDEQVEAGDIKVEYRPIPFLAGRFDDSRGGRQRLRRSARRLRSGGRQGVPRPPVRQPAGGDGAPPRRPTSWSSGPSRPVPTEDDVRPGIEDMAFEGWVDAAGDAASDAGVNSTPTVLVDGERVEGETLQDIASQMVG